MTHTRPLVERMIAALEDRVNLNTRRAAATSGVGQKKAKARLSEASEILGILRNVVAAWDKDIPRYQQVDPSRYLPTMITVDGKKMTPEEYRAQFDWPGDGKPFDPKD